MDATVIGMLIGGLFRLAPEGMKYFDRHLDRRHELAMQDKQIEFAKINEHRPDMMPELRIDMDTLARSVNQQMKAESKWSPYVRPVTTYVLLAVYILPLLLQWRSYSEQADLPMLAGVLNFWYLDRMMKK